MRNDNLKKSTHMESIRNMLDKYIDTSNLSDVEILRIIENETIKRESFLNTERR